MESGMDIRWRYTNIDRKRYLLLASVPTVLLSIPANILNYSPIEADYMYFTGKFILLQILFPRAPRPAITLLMYFLYIGIPPFFFLPSYISQRRKKKLAEEAAKTTEIEQKEKVTGEVG